MCSRPAWVTEQDPFSKTKSNKNNKSPDLSHGPCKLRPNRTGKILVLLKSNRLDYLTLCQYMFFSEMQSHRWAHKAAVSRTDLLSTWLLFRWCHGECPGLFLILAVVFHPGYPQSPYKDRKSELADSFKSTKHKMFTVSLFFLQCLQLNPRCLHTMHSPSLLLTLCRQTPGQSLPFTRAPSYLPTYPLYTQRTSPTVFHTHSWLFQTYSPWNSSWE